MPKRAQLPSAAWSDSDTIPAATDLLPELRELLRRKPNATISIEDADDGELLRTLRGVGPDGLAAVRTEDVPTIVGELARIQVALTARLMAPPTSTPTDDGIDAMKAEDAARRLALPESYIRELTRRGEIPCVRRGKYVRIRVADLRDWVLRHRDDEQPTTARTPKKMPTRRRAR